MVSKLITTKQLFEALQSNQKLHILDTTHILPSISPIENHYNHRIPNSKFLDMKEISNKSSEYTLTMPTQAEFIEHMRKIRVKNDSVPIVLYDLFNMTTPRAWFMFKVFGRENVSILDGGFSKWLSENRPFDSGKYEIYSEKDSGPGYDYEKNEKLLRNFDDVVKITKNNNEEILDARPKKAFEDGKIPGSKNLSFENVYEADKTFKSPDKLKKLYLDAGVDLSKTIVNSCRIGHSASVNLFALSLIGADSVLYDGSWEEWSKKAKV